MTVSADAPYLDMAYKLVRYGSRDVLKISPDKETWTGEKQVFRRRTADGQRYLEDVLALREEPNPPDARPLLETVMERGRLVGPLPTLAAARAHCAEALRALPDRILQITGTARYPVRVSDGLALRQQAVKAATVAAEVAGQAGSRSPR
jgi:nicotinate phosphoribosyltransferase